MDEVFGDDDNRNINDDNDDINDGVDDEYDIGVSECVHSTHVQDSFYCSSSVLSGQQIIIIIISSVRSSYSHPDLLVTHHQHPTFSDHTGPQHWTFTF